MPWLPSTSSSQADDAVEGEHRQLVGGEQADLHVAAAAAQRADASVLVVGRTDRVDGDVGAASVMSWICVGSGSERHDGVLGADARARSRAAGLRSTAMTRAPRAEAIITALRPTPPAPKTATHSPGCTRLARAPRGRLSRNGSRGWRPHHPKSVGHARPG